MKYGSMVDSILINNLLLLNTKLRFKKAENHLLLCDTTLFDVNITVDFRTRRYEI